MENNLSAAVGRHRANSQSRGFTLVELLVTISIIAILIAILLPVVSIIRQKARIAQTQQEISRLQGAVERYYLDFNAYPGPLSNDDIIAGVAPTNVTLAPGARGVTMSENLVLGLAGGLQNTTPGTTPTVAYIVGSSYGGSGPQDLGIRTVTHPPYFDPGNGELTKNDPTNGGMFVDLERRTCKDTNIPEYLDHFADDPMPILYFRARVGSHGVISDGTTTDPSTGNAAAYQYDIRQNDGYTTSQIGLLKAQFPSHGLSAAEGKLNPPNSIAMLGSNGSYMQPNDGLPFIGASSADVSQMNYAGIPKCKDSYLLISAGPYHTYGTKDNIVNFGSFR